MELRKYQTEIAQQAIKILKDRMIVYLAMEVRCGKTLTALTIAQLWNAKSVLFITKLKAISSIVDDFNSTDYQYKLKVTNYEQIKKLNPEDYDFIIVDEAHSLKKFPKPSLRAKEVKRIVRSSPLVLLSGTPSPESYSELFHQFWVSPYSPFRSYYNFYTWAKDYVKVFEEKHGQFVVKNYSNANKEEVMKILNPYIISYTQEEAGFTCPVIEKIHYVDCIDTVSLIKELFKNRIINICSTKKFSENELSNDSIVAESPAGLLTKMHQLSGGTCIGEKRTHIFSEEKAKYIKKTFENKKIAIFYKFQAELDILKKYFPDNTGNVDEFKTTKKTFLAQIISGREGIALDSADAIVMYAIDFASVSYWQARGRLQALHRSTPAEVHWIFTSSGIEKKIYKAVCAKKDFTLSFFMRNGGINAIGE